MFSRRRSRGDKPTRKTRGRSSVPAAFPQTDSSASESGEGTSAHGTAPGFGTVFDPTVWPPSSGGAAQTSGRVAPAAGTPSVELDPLAGTLYSSSARAEQTDVDRAASGKSKGFTFTFPSLPRLWDAFPRNLAPPWNRMPSQDPGPPAARGAEEQGQEGPARRSLWTLGWGRKEEAGMGGADRTRPGPEPGRVGKPGRGWIFGGAGRWRGSAAGSEREAPALPWDKGGDFSQWRGERMESVAGGNGASRLSYRDPGSITIDEHQAPSKQSQATPTRSDSSDNMELGSEDTDRNLGQTGKDVDRQIGSKFRTANEPQPTFGQETTPVKKAKWTFTSDMAEALDQPDTDPSAAIRQTLRGYTDITLRRVTEFYRQRIEEAIEEYIEAVSLMILHKIKSHEDLYREIQRLVKDGSHRRATEHLLDSVMESGAQAGRVMWETFIKMKLTNPKLSNILQEIESKGASLRMEVSQSLMEPKVSNYLKDVQTQYKSFLLRASEDFWVDTVGGKRERFCLEECYTEQVIVVSGPERGVAGHSLTARGKRREEGQRKLIKSQWETVRIGQLFRSSFGKSSLSGTVVVSGPAGSGKTTMVRKIVRDWADGKAYQQFHFVFLFNFRDLNSVAGRTSLKKLILNSYPHFGNSVERLWEQPQGLLFILDSLEEFKEKIDFEGPKGNALPEHQCFHPECLCEVSDIVRCLIRQDVLKGCSVLLTTRPTELQRLRNAGINLWAEIVGFLREQRKEFLAKYFGDRSLAEAAFTYLEQNEVLYSMCDNPSYCRIICSSLAPGLQRMQATQETLPTTVTQLFASYTSNIFKNHQFNIYKRHAVSAEQIRDLVLRTGQLAYLGICQNIHVFHERHLNSCNVERSCALPGFLTQHTDPNSSQALFSFVHVTLQEFMAALGQYLTADPQSLAQLLTELLDSPQADPQFKMFLRFTAGLSSPGSARILKDLLGPLPHETTCSVIDWVKTQVEVSSTKRRLLESMYYLFESQHTGLMQLAVGLRGTLTLGDDFPGNAIPLSPLDCSVLGSVIQRCGEVQELNLSNCGLGTEGIQRLASALHKCKVLRLRGNNLTDDGVNLLSETLKREDCKIQQLDLSSNGISHTGAQELAKGLSSNSSLTQLNLSRNKLGDTGMTDLCEALSSPQCKIQSLLICENLIRGNIIEKLVSTLSTNRSLTSLNLNKNKLGDRGIRLVAAVLGQRSCTLQTLELQWNRFSADGLRFLQSLNRPGLCVQVYTSIMSGGLKHCSQANKERKSTDD
ncbi:NACHT, LRR and PYD domains-containing protein 3-like isoform X2 [Hemiscyllium ocellatum]|uniref:NACHT, LRR and PYD domains-containing protein 3-like isoform X2 n=1 Tax=Hemiscyllium ocellatum TaxID=170820 RepID=UPI002965E788|nr:NACHT, LRR and PYD domains-containing protein 3-like isoform X2 [Hemiscyllium ocellatum]